MQGSLTLGVLNDINDPVLVVLFSPPRLCANAAFFRVGDWDSCTTRPEHLFLDDDSLKNIFEPMRNDGSQLRVAYRCKNSPARRSVTLLFHPLGTSGSNSSGYFCSCCFEPDSPCAIDWRQLFYEYLPNRAQALEILFDSNDARFWFANKKSTEFFGFCGPFGCLGKQVGRDLHWPQEEIDWWLKKASEMIEGNVTELTFKKTVDRGERPCVTIRTTVRAVSGWDPPRFFMFDEDVTELQQLEDELAQKGAQLEGSKREVTLFQHFFEQAPIIMGLVRLEEHDFFHLLSNKRSGDLDLVGRRGSELHTEEDLRFWMDRFLESRTQNRLIQFEWKCSLRLLGDGRWYSVSVSWFSEDRYLYLMADISSQKEHASELETAVSTRTRQLEEALRVKSRFLATMSHEIRTPLAGLLGSVTVLMKCQNQDEHSKQELLHITQVCSEQLSSLIDDLLDVARLEEHKVRLEAIEFSLVDLLHDSLEVISMALSQDQKNQLEVIYDIDDEALPQRVIGDPRRIRQILINLLQNAIKFTAKGEVALGVVTAAKQLHENRCEIVLSIRDTGVGIADDFKEKIFQPFAQADSSLTRSFGGSGLGLYICRRLLELMDGSIWFESTLETGTTFFVRLTFPIVATPPQPPEQSIPILSSKVIVVDSNRAFREVLLRTLQRKGFSCVYAFSTVVDALRSGCSDGCLLIDSKQDLSDLNLSKASRLNVVVMGYDPPASGRPAAELAADFIRKPIRASNLWRVLAPKSSASITTTSAIPSFTTGPRKERILIVEDNRTNQLIIRRLLESMGYQDITITENGLEAIRQVQTESPFDIILMDLMMPVMGGIDATLQLRSMNLSPRPRIIALTANALPEQRDECIRAGMDLYLTKPIRPEALREALA